MLQQAAIVSFIIILARQQYILYLEPVPYFNDNCEDCLYNMIFIIFLTQIGIYFFFYVSLLLLIITSPIFLGVFISMRIIRWVQRKRKRNLIKKLTVRIVEKTEKDEVCSICLSSFEVGQRVKVLNCGHDFHDSCIDGWFAIQFVCPLCRKRFE